MPEAILVADDEPGVRESLAEILRDAGYEVQAAADGTAAFAALDARDFGLVITDIRMPGADGIAVLKRAREISPQTLVLVMTAHGSVETAVEALRAGATDYILKPVVFDELLAKVERLIELRQLMWQAQMLRREVEARYNFEGLVGQSRAMRGLRSRPEGRADPEHGPHHRRERHGEGGRRARRPSVQPGRPAHLPPRQRRGGEGVMPERKKR